MIYWETRTSEAEAGGKRPETHDFPEEGLEEGGIWLPLTQDTSLCNANLPWGARPAPPAARASPARSCLN